MRGFWKRCFATGRFFEYAAKSAGGERLRQEGRNLALAERNLWHYSTEWKLRFIQNVASCYVLCLTKESVITATLLHAPVCVCVPRTPHGGLSDTSALEISSGGGSGLNSLPVRIRTRVRTLRSPAVQGRCNWDVLFYGYRTVLPCHLPRHWLCSE